jgi:hypothetical protein
MLYPGALGPDSSHERASAVADRSRERRTRTVIALVTKQKMPKITIGVIAWQRALGNQSHMGVGLGRQRWEPLKTVRVAQGLARLAGTSPLFGYMRLSE